jgi:hypothetical protein
LGIRPAFHDGQQDLERAFQALSFGVHWPLQYKLEGKFGRKKIRKAV